MGIQLGDLSIKTNPHSIFNTILNPLSARIFTVFGHSLLEDRVLHKEAWVAKLLGTHSVSRFIKRSNFHGEITQHWHLKG